ncbi:Uncharacterised protein [Enterobacter cloacae]|jgi:hypothetical protein|nr:hypothetical protein AI2797V1_2418 [Enterobacter cloacae]CZU23482.1 Uncharacterised protein [Enterobacter asburiae]CAE7811457.1 hypothetical protein AI2802V1_2416 [Enterobacter cloacae]CAH3708057.1 hypothetical protein AI2797V1_2418 [Enterobacter cloacae]CAH3981628.1 hypothetical protein AI2802V1_2416 [Enterobacter cloacae]
MFFGGGIKANILVHLLLIAEGGAFTGLDHAVTAIGTPHLAGRE